VQVIVRSAPEKIMGISGEKIAAHYSIKESNLKVTYA